LKTGDGDQGVPGFGVGGAVGAAEEGATAIAAGGWAGACVLTMAVPKSIDRRTN